MFIVVGVNGGQFNGKGQISLYMVILLVLWSYSAFGAIDMVYSNCPFIFCVQLLAYKNYSNEYLPTLPAHCRTATLSLPLPMTLIPLELTLNQVTPINAFHLYVLRGYYSYYLATLPFRPEMCRDCNWPRNISPKLLLQFIGKGPPLPFSSCCHGLCASPR